MANETLLTRGIDDLPKQVVDNEYTSIMKDYDIDHCKADCWKLLAKKLATEYHPDFKNPVGRPKHRDTTYYAFLLANVEHFRQHEGLDSDKAALRVLLERFPDLLVGSNRSDHPPSFASLEDDLKTARSLRRTGELKI